jgi:protein-disulfide isomerase
MQRKKTLKGRPIRRRRRSPLPILIVGAAAIAFVLAFILLTAGSEGGAGEIVIPTPAASRTAPQSGAVLGRQDAPVTIVEYFSFSCPHCGDFALDTAPLIEKDFVEAGQVRFELHPMALDGAILAASEAAACAGDQGRYWEYHETLFANFEVNKTDAYKSGPLKEYAKLLGLDANAFNSCLDSHKYRDAVVGETEKVVAAGISATPNFFIGLTKDMNNSSPPYPGTRHIVGAQPYEVFKAAIEEKLGTAP